MRIIVETTAMAATTGTLKMGGHVFPCTLGRSGVIVAEDKVEGDGKTPLGTYPLRYLLYRADRAEKPETGLRTEVLTPDTGWCEDSAHADYNRQVRLPHASVVDKMTREDDLYDYVVVIGHNDNPVVKGKGSAIFLHLARPDFSPTAGCVGLRREDLLTVLGLCDAATAITILPPPDSRS